MSTRPNIIKTRPTVLILVVFAEIEASPAILLGAQLVTEDVFTHVGK